MRHPHIFKNGGGINPTNHGSCVVASVRNPSFAKIDNGRIPGPRRALLFYKVARGFCVSAPAVKLPAES